MKTLLILRHGKSSWSDPELADHDRPLKKRGRRGARRIGRQLRERNLIPELVLTSTATRAHDTARRCLEAAGAPARLEATPALYMGGVDRHLRTVRERVGDDDGTVMVVGHNPDLELLVERLAGESQRLKTAYLAVVDLPIAAWTELPQAAGSLRLVLRPG